MTRLAHADHALSRRAFIGARWRSASSGTQSALTIGPSCLSNQGIACRVCAEHCGAGAIHFRPMRGGIAAPIVDAAACTGCGDCQAACPAAAIALGAGTASCA